jgi:hypothetical protein
LYVLMRARSWNAPWLCIGLSACTS